MIRSEGRAVWLPDVLRDAGLRVEVVPGWERRGNDPKRWLAQIFHHTASSPSGGDRPSLGICTHGRGGPNPVPGPLANALVTRSGTWVVIAAGAANHPGVSYLPLNGGISSGVKYWCLGWECENSGTGEPWRNLDAIEIGEAAVGRYLGWPVESNVFGHKEIARPLGRKIDPFGIDMGEHRRRVADRRRIDTSPNPTTPKDWLEMASEAEVRKIVREEVGALLKPALITLDEQRKATTAIMGRLGSAVGWAKAHALKAGVTRDEAYAADPSHAKP